MEVKALKIIDKFSGSAQQKRHFSISSRWPRAEPDRGSRLAWRLLDADHGPAPIA
jgi:hypothetical protein